MRVVYTILLAFSLALLAGCTQAQLPQSCAGLSSEGLAACIYESAVLEQNPFSCYSLPEGSLRSACLADASDSSMKKLLERLTPQERAQLLGLAAASAEAPGTGALPYAPAETGQGAPEAEQPGAAGADSQYYGQAVESSDMAACTSISDPSMRASCITQVALQVKKPEVCNALALKADIDICNLYAKAGEQAK